MVGIHRAGLHAATSTAHVTASHVVSLGSADGSYGILLGASCWVVCHWGTNSCCALLALLIRILAQQLRKLAIVNY